MEAIRLHPDVARAEATRWLGDWHPLIRQIAPGEGIADPRLARASQAARVTASPADLRAFLLDYKSSVLLPHELPAVMRSCEHTQRGETTELLALDRALHEAPWLAPYQADSRTAGRLHLERLRPLRDQRGLRRYLAAVERGEAYGWHLLVAGVALGLYSLPLRQGLMDYALHTFWNVVGHAAGPLELEPRDAAEIVGSLSSDLPARIQSMLPPVRLAAV